MQLLKFFLNLAMLAFLSAGGLVFTLFLYQNKIVYVHYLPPDARTEFLRPLDYGLPYFQEIFVTTPDKENIQCWYFPTLNYQRCPTIIFFHGNAGNISHRLPNIKKIVKHLKCNVFIVEYRGYGKSSGEPSEEGIKLDAQAALDYLLTKMDIDKENIYIFGRSLGGAVALHLAATNPGKIKALIIENTFTSILDMLENIFPLLRHFKFLSTNRWMSIEAVEKINIPCLFITAKNDKVVPPWMMKRLYDACPSTLKEFHSYDREHMDAWIDDEYFIKTKKWLNTLGNNLDDTDNKWTITKNIVNIQNKIV